MKNHFRVLFALLIVLTLLCVLAVGVSAEETDENAPGEEIAVDEENGLSRVEALWITLITYIGTLITVGVVAYKIIKQFKDLRADVIADGQIAAIKKEIKTQQKSIDRLIQNQENETKDTESLQRSIQSMEQTAQKLELHMCRIEAKIGGNGDDAEV